MDMNGLVRDFSAKLASGLGTVFVGAGISVPSKLCTWASLLEPFAKTIDLRLNENDDLPQIAQFIVNENGNNRGPLIDAIRNGFTRTLINSYHESLRKTNLQTIWTTNYDTLLEDAFANFIKDVKTHDDAISRTIDNHQIEIIKIHGCIATSKSSEIVITQEDYEDYFIKRPATANRLRNDLLNKSFLFIGHGYGDPNIKNILVQARRYANAALRQHYMIQKQECSPESAKRQKYLVNDLKRFGIACVLINDYKELDEALHSIMLKSRGNTVFVTGGHDHNLQASLEYGKALADIENLKLLDGQSEGISRSVISAFTEVCIKKKQDIRDRIQLFPNPYRANSNFSNDETLLPELKKWRVPLLRMAHVVVVFPGGIGTKAEVEVAKEMGCFILPAPQKKDDLPSKLLKDSKIRQNLELTVPEYLTKAKTFSVTPEIIKEYVERLLST